MKWTLAEIERLKASGKIKGYAISEPKKEGLKLISPTRKGKYNNEKVEFDGKLFDSKKELKRYKELLLMLKAGLIGYLKTQVTFELNAGGTHSYKYIADFTYTDAKTGEKIIEDCKGCRTAVYKKKRRLMKKLFDIIIKET